MESIEAAFNRSLSQGHPGSHRPSNALEVLCSEVLKLEQIAQELSGALGNDDAVRLCNALQACCKVRRLADDGLLLRSARSDQVADDHQSRGNTDARLQGRVGLQVTYSRDQLQPRAHGPLGVVFMGLGVPEVDEDAIAHVLRDEPAEATHGLCDALLIGRNDLAQVLRVHARRERRRADKVREHHRHLTALGTVFWSVRLGRSAWCRRQRTAPCRSRRHAEQR